jgi:hypothetical protein
MQADWETVVTAGYTLAGFCLMYYKSPAGDAIMHVTTVDSPLPVTIDRVIDGTPPEVLEERNPGYTQVSLTEVDKLNAVVVFTCDAGKGMQLWSVRAAPPQVWYVTCIADADAYAGYESQFADIVASLVITD